jgi:hypothetical protein
VIVLPETDVVYEGAQVRLQTRPGLEVCAGNGPSMDRMVEFFGRETALGNLDAPVDVYLLEPDEVTEVCGLDYIETFACAFVEDVRPFVVTSYLPTEHEVIHTYLSFKQSVARTRYSFFEEGLASVYGRDGFLPRPTTDLYDAMGYVRELPGEHYPRAAHFVSFLVDEFGVEATTEFVLATADVGSSVGLAETFEANFGVELDRFIAEYESSAPTCSSDGWQRGYNCQDVGVGWHFSGTLRVDVGSPCDTQGVLGVDGRGTYERFVVDFDEPATLSVRLLSPVVDSYPRVRMTRCGSCGDEFVLDYDLERGALFGAQVDAGKYLVNVFDSEGTPEPTALEIRRQ